MKKPKTRKKSQKWKRKEIKRAENGRRGTRIDEGEDGGWMKGAGKRIKEAVNLRTEKLDERRRNGWLHRMLRDMREVCADVADCPGGSGVERG